MLELNLSGKRIVVTGASGFLGAHIKNALKDEMAVSFCIDKVKAEEIDEVDITNKKSIDEYIDTLQQWYLKNGEKIDGIVNNAAISIKGDNLTHEQFVETMNVNVASMYSIIKAFQPILSKNASIVNISSMYGVISPDFSIYKGDMSLYNSSAYGASKAAILQLTRYYAVQLAPIRVNAVSPGGIFQGHRESFLDLYNKKVPLRRMADPQEIVSAILFLLSPMSSYITGHNLVVDGGMSIW